MSDTPAMPRAEMAEELQNLHPPMPLSWEDAVARQQLIDAAAAALSQRCGNCRHFSIEDRTIATCRESVARERMVPFDGSGFCHRWQAKEDR